MMLSILVLKDTQNSTLEDTIRHLEQQKKTHLLPRDSLDVNDIFLSVDGDNLSLFTLVRSTGDLDLVVDSDWEGLDVVLRSHLLGQRSAHSHSSLRGGSGEVCLSLFASRRGDIC